MPYITALALTVSDKKSFKVFFFFFSVAMATKFLSKIKVFMYSESVSPKDHFCEVSLKSVCRFQRRISFSNCLQTDSRTLTDHNSSPGARKNTPEGKT